jgi:hypothetical protein
MAGAVSLKNSFLDGVSYVSVYIVALVLRFVKAMGVPQRHVDPNGFVVFATQDLRNQRK